jgi:KDO2-lipid IV(A) lauroyltransferase
MARPRSATTDYLIYVAVRVVVGVLQMLPYGLACVVARWLAWLAYRVDRRHRQVALDNLRHAFPGRYTEDGLHELVRAVYRHFGQVLIEMLFIPRMLHPHNWRRHIRLATARPLVDVLLSGRPVLIVTGHFGNWEMAGYALAMLGFRSYAVARPLDNPHLDRFLRRFRERTGQQLLAKKGELDRIEGILQSGGIVCTLADQDAGQRGLFVDFFGRPASTHKAVALLALEHRALVVVAGAYRVGEPLVYEIRATDVIDPAEYAGDPDAVRALTARCTAALERLVRIDIRQYFWLHRRWKHQPPAKRDRRVA